MPITVGNRPPVITIEFPKDGQVASFTDKVNYKISVSDPEDGTTDSGISCNDVRVDVSLGHDEHAHTLSSTTGCTGTFNTGLTSGHGAEANTFTVLGVSYTDKGAAGAPALTGRAQAILQPKTKQAEFFASTGRVADGGTNGDAGVTKETTTDTAGGGQNLGFIEDGDYVSYKPYNLEGVTAMRFRVASAGAGGTIEVRLDSPTGTLVGTTATITPTGDWQTFKDVTLNLTNPPTGTHELFLVVPQQGQHPEPVQRELVRGGRQGRRDHGLAGGHRHRHAAHRHRAAEREVRRHGDRPRGQGAHLRVGLRRARHDH